MKNPLKLTALALAIAGTLGSARAAPAQPDFPSGPMEFTTLAAVSGSSGAFASARDMAFALAVFEADANQADTGLDLVLVGDNQSFAKGQRGGAAGFPEEVDAYKSASAGAGQAALIRAAAKDDAAVSAPPLKGLASPAGYQQVPEPEAYVMMLAGLGLFGAIAHRRRQI